MDPLVGIAIGTGLSAACGFRVFVPLLAMNFAYYIPWLDHLLDLITSPAAIIAGIVATASMVMDISPFLKWTLALIAGGGAAAIVQGVTIILRTKSSVLTAGTGNVFVSSLELVGSIITVLLAMIVPILCLGLIALLCIFIIWKAGRFFIGRLKINRRLTCHT